MQADTLTIPLDPPLSVGGVEYPELKLREPTAGELAQTDGLSGYASDLQIVSVVTALPIAAVKKIPARAFVRATKFIGSFMKPDPETGDDD